MIPHHQYAVSIVISFEIFQMVKYFLTETLQGLLLTMFVRVDIIYLEIVKEFAVLKGNGLVWNHFAEKTRHCVIYYLLYQMVNIMLQDILQVLL